jgi:molybdopterin molybdotransferase
MLRRMLGLAEPLARRARPLAAPLPANGPRRHFMRARIDPDGRVRAAESQDSSLLRTLAEAECLIDRPPHAPEAAPDETVETLDL